MFFTTGRKMEDENWEKNYFQGLCRWEVKNEE
jgi:hypothetical protein